MFITDPKFQDVSNSPPTQNSNFEVNCVCAHCFALDHKAQDCFNPWRCKVCFNYGHKARWCFPKSKPKLLWAPKKCYTALPVEPSAKTPLTVETPPLDSRAGLSKNPHLPYDSTPSPSYSVDRSPDSPLPSPQPSSSPPSPEPQSPPLPHRHQW